MSEQSDSVVDLLLKQGVPANQCYCGSCGVDYSDMDLAGLVEMASRRTCLECRHLARDFSGGPLEWAFKEPAECVRCGEVYDEASGEGYNGFCPGCADATEPAEKKPRAGGSTVMTPAPQSARMAEAAGTKVCSATSRMRTPSMMSANATPPFLRKNPRGFAATN